MRPGCPARHCSISSERTRVVSPHQFIGPSKKLGSPRMLGRAQRIQRSASTLKRHLPFLYAQGHAFPDPWNRFSLAALHGLPRRASQQQLGRFPQRTVLLLGQATGKRSPTGIGSRPPFTVFQDLKAVFTLTVRGQHGLATRLYRDRSCGAGRHRHAGLGLRKTRQAIADQKCDQPLPHQLQHHLPGHPAVYPIRWRADRPSCQRNPVLSAVAGQFYSDPATNSGQIATQWRRPLV